MCSFKIGIYLGELRLPFEQALDVAGELGVKYVWYSEQSFGKPFIDMSDSEVDAVGQAFAARDMTIFLLAPGNCFKQVHLADLDLATMEQHPEFRAEMRTLDRQMEVAAQLGVPAVNTFTFAWPGEYTAGKPTWPMRWLTRGGVISDLDMQKLVKGIGLMAERAEHHGVDLALSQMPWNYTNTTGNFRRVAEAVGSPRLKVMWGPSDNYNSGEADVATAGFVNVRPYLYGLHLKDLRVNDGVHLDFDYCAIGDGDVDYPAVLRNVRDHECDVVLSLSTHFRPPGGDSVDAMRLNHRNLMGLIDRLESGSVSA